MMSGGAVDIVLAGTVEDVVESSRSETEDSIPRGMGGADSSA